MLYNTRGIIFHQVKYSEASLIVKIYTEVFGLQTYIIRGIRSKKSSIKFALLQPLTLIEMVVYHREKKDIQQLKEIKITSPFKSIPFDIRKSSVILFITEILYNVIREQEPNQDLFDFIYNAILSFDQIENGIASFHLHFMMNLTKYLGFFPKNNYSRENSVFDMQEGMFTNHMISSNTLIVAPYSEYFAKLITASNEPMKINPSHQTVLLECMIRYYKIHNPDIKEIKSHHILQSVLND